MTDAFTPTSSWVVAVDDDPTGCQSVSGVPLVTSWDIETLTEAARLGAPATFVLTNSRSLDEAAAIRVNEEVGRSLARVAGGLGRTLRLVSRSDSTLRGHYPAEVDALCRGAGVEPDGVIICPAFFEAGRFTAEGVQWVLQDGELIAASDTEFARDTTFGFAELTLAEWAAVRQPDRSPAMEIPALLLARADRQGVAALLQSAAGGQPIVVNATNYAQLAVFVDALEEVEAMGMSFVYRTGPSFVRARARLGSPAVADFRALIGVDSTRNGLVVVGSHTEVTNTQIGAALDAHPSMAVIELDTEQILDGADGVVAATVAEVADRLAETNVLLRTSRQVSSRDHLDPLEAGRAVSAALVDVVRSVVVGQPVGWVIAKGGITSHDLLTKGFDVGLTNVAGQALPGMIPVLEVSGSDGLPLPFVIFPGNVGSPTTLADVVSRILA